MCSQFIGCMEEKNEVIKQKTSKLVVPNEQQFLYGCVFHITAGKRKCL